MRIGGDVGPLSVPHDDFADEQSAQHPELVVSQSSTISQRQSEVVEFLCAVADPEHIGGPAFAHEVQDCHVLGQSHWVIERQNDHQAQHQPLRARGYRRGEDERRGQITVFGTVVFAQHAGETPPILCPRTHPEGCGVEVRRRSTPQGRTHLESESEHQLPVHRD